MKFYKAIFCLILLCALINMGCRDTGGGDVPDLDTGYSDGSILPDGGSADCGLGIWDLQQNAAQYNGTSISLTSVIVTAVSDKGFWVEAPEGDACDRGREYSGVYVYGANSVAGRQIGEVVDLSGTFAIYYGVNEVTYPTLPNGNQTGPITSQIPAAKVVNDSNIKTGGADAAKYMGVLVKIENVTIANKDQYYVYSTQGGLKIDDVIYAITVGKDTMSQKIEVGQTYTITGILHLDYGEMKLLPRMESDIVGGTPGEDTGYPDGGTGDNTIYEIQQGQVDIDAGVNVENVIVTAVGKEGFWVEEAEAGPYSGIYIYGKNGASGRAAGQVVNVRGTYIKYYGCNEISTRSASDVTVVQEEGTVPDPVVVDDAVVKTGAADAFQYLGVLIKVEGVTIVSKHASYNYYMTAGGLKIDDELFSGFSLVEGNTYDIIGVLHYNYDEMQLYPRNADDIQGEGGPPPTEETISWIQQNALKNKLYNLLDVYATTENLWTSTKGHGFYVGEYNGSGDGSYSGLLIYFYNGVPNYPTVANIGDKISIYNGSYAVFQGKSELKITNGNQIVITPGSPIEPVEITEDDLNLSNFDKWEDVLIKITISSPTFEANNPGNTSYAFTIVKGAEKYHITQDACIGLGSGPCWNPLPNVTTCGGQVVVTGIFNVYNNGSILNRYISPRTDTEVVCTP